jgi:hypothetical protein
MRSRVSSIFSAAIFALVGILPPASTCALAQANNAQQQQQQQATNQNQGQTSPQPQATPATKSFGGLTFGIGLGLSLNTQSTSRVTSASVVNGIVRVTQTDDASADFVLETHYFFVPNRNFFSVPQGDWGHGPFVGIVASPTGTNVIAAYTLGWMIGFREPSWTYDDKAKQWNATYSTSSWNFGIGVRVDPSVQVLGQGLVANQPLPAGETSIRYENKPGYGLMLLSSFSF